MIVTYKNITEWFVVGFGGIVGTAVIYYVIIDGIIILNTMIIRDINELINKLKQNPMKNK